MTIDERWECLTERHEALIQSVEMFTRGIDKLGDIAGSTLDSIKRLERIALPARYGWKTLMNDSMSWKKERHARYR